MRRDALRAALAAAAALALGPEVRGGDIGGFVEVTATRTEQEGRDAAGESTLQESHTFSERYSLAWERRLFPNLRVSLGGLFERDDVEREVNGTPSDSRISLLRPYASFQLATEPLRVQFNLTRSDEGQESAGNAETRTIRDALTASVRWRPADAAFFRLQYNRADARDENRETLDTQTDSLQLFSEYSPTPRSSLRYRGALDNSDDRIAQTKVRGVLHSGRASWNGRFWRERTALTTDYNVTYRETETTSAPGGEVEFPVFAPDGLFALDDTPSEGLLQDAPGLTDANRAASAGIDIGLPAPGADDRPRNLGLDLGEPTTVNTLFVWVDRDLDPGIADSFAWTVYASADGELWDLVVTLAAAPFGPFESRFDLRFPSVTRRFVKVVVEPLDDGVPFADDWPDIFVTELEPVERRPAEEVEGTTSRTNHLYNVAVRTRLLEERALFHELSYSIRKTSDVPSTWTLSNGLSLIESLNDVWTLSVRASRDEGKEVEDDRREDLVVASLTATPLPTLRHNLVVNRTREEIGELSEERGSVLVNTTAELYRGVDLNLGVGRTVLESSLDPRTETSLVNALATIRPHRSLTLNLTYQDRSTRETGTLQRAREQFTEAREAAVTFNPFLTVYFFGSYRVESREGIAERTLRDYTLTLTPFPDGTLRFFVRYNESFTSDIGQKERRWTPSLRWDVTPRWFLDLVFQRREIRAPLQRLDSELLSATMRYTF